MCEKVRMTSVDQTSQSIATMMVLSCWLIIKASDTHPRNATYCIILYIAETQRPKTLRDTTRARRIDPSISDKKLLQESVGSSWWFGWSTATGLLFPMRTPASAYLVFLPSHETYDMILVSYVVILKYFNTTVMFINEWESYKWFIRII